MNVGFVGTGAIAEAMVTALAGQGHSISVSDRNAAVAARLGERHAEVRVRSNQAVLDASEVIVLCLMADVAAEVLPRLSFGARHRVVSVMADVPLDRLADLCAPATELSITIPLPAIAQGGCPLPVFPRATTVAALFGAANPVFAVRDERALNAHFAATALLSVVTDQMRVTADWLAAQTGSPADAEAYVRALVQGHVATMRAEDGLAHALDQLATEGGFNATLRAAMEAAGAPAALRRGLDGFRGRLGLD